MSSPKISLIISTYNQANYLPRVLTALGHQTSLPEEVLLADDGSDDGTGRIFTDWGAKQPFGHHHLWQKNAGYRRSHILNEAIAKSSNDYVVFLDGDTVPHPRFVSDHAMLAAADCFAQGHRVLVDKEAAAWFGQNEFGADRSRALWSGQLNGWVRAFRWPRPLRRFRSDLRGIRGCNLGVWRRDLVRVNGYNEALTGWGREDSELAVRLMNSGVRRMDARGWLLCYHLWHPPASRAGLAANDIRLNEAQSTKATRCANGLDQHL